MSILHSVEAKNEENYPELNLKKMQFGSDLLPLPWSVAYAFSLVMQFLELCKFFNYAIFFNIVIL